MNTIHFRRKNKIAVFWMSQNYDVIQNELFPYVKDFQLDKEWEKVRLVLCEPSIKLIALDQELKENLEDLRRIGVELIACKSHNYPNVKSKILVTLGIKDVFLNDPIEEYKETNWAVLVF